MRPTTTTLREAATSELLMYRPLSMIGLAMLLYSASTPRMVPRAERSAWEARPQLCMMLVMSSMAGAVRRTASTSSVVIDHHEPLLKPL